MRDVLVLLVFASLLACQSPVPVPTPTPTPVPTPVPTTVPVPRDQKAVDATKTAAIAALQEQFEKATTTVATVLADRANDDLRDKTPFRDLLKKYASTAPVTMVAKDEPGTRLSVEGRIDDEQGKPIADALVYAYHTDTRGFYGYERAHVGGNSGDFLHARLFAYARTDAKGAFVLQTIRPASYPDTDLPQHIHFEVTAKDKSPLNTEIMFADDPMMNPAARQNATRSHFPVVEVVDDKKGPQRCQPVLVLRAAAGKGGG